MNSIELSAAITAAANALAQNLSASELTLLASTFVQLGDTLATVAAFRALAEDQNKS